MQKVKQNEWGALVLPTGSELCVNEMQYIEGGSGITIRNIEIMEDLDINAPGMNVQVGGAGVSVDFLQACGTLRIGVERTVNVAPRATQVVQPVITFNAAVRQPAVQVPSRAVAAVCTPTNLWYRTYAGRNAAPGTINWAR
ncbi:MAG: hypothetical protein FWB72_00125 [Firmicutes bacterium]|nr:hypothetical protein [Bacillota bacterium]